MEKNRLETLTLPQVLKQLGHTIKHLESQIASLGKMIQEHVAQSPTLSQQTERLCQMQGVGLITATGLLATIQSCEPWA